MPTIPSSIDEVTTEWIAEVTDLRPTVVEPELIGVGIGVSSAVYRLRLSGPGTPDSLVLKLKAFDEAAVFTSTMLRMYEREVKFFDELSAAAPIRVPKGYGGALAEDGSGYFLLMEDMGGHRAVDQIAGMDIADAERAIDALAKWHAAYWGLGEPHADSGAALSLNNEIYHGVLPLVFSEGWEIIKSGDIAVPPIIADVAPRWVDNMATMLERLVEGATTICHGDYRADNIFFDRDDQVVLLDFQLTSLGSAAYDVAYFVTQSLLPDVAAEHERRLFDRYIAALIDAGVALAETEPLWEQYRVAALFCLVYPVVAVRGMDMSDPRQASLFTTMSSGCARAIEALDLADLLA